MEPPKKICIPRSEGGHEENDGCAEKTQNGLSPLIFLPKELWTQIFNHVPQKDRLRHRMVSKEWCKNVDEFSSVDVNFNADYPSEKYRDRVFELRIRSCTFSSLHLPFSPKFKNPLLVKEITFTTHVSASNVLKILRVCRNIESLRFLTTMTSETYLEANESTAETFNSLKNLQYLEIGILTFLDRSPLQQSKTFSAIIGNPNVVFPALRTLSIAFLVRHIEWCQIFKFISRHSVTLKSVNAICPCGERPVGAKQRAQDTLIPKDLPLPPLESLVVNGASDCSCRDDVWLLLNQQKQFRRFETDIPQSAMFLKEIVSSNQSTIKTLRLHEIGNLYSDELNCDIFEQCLSLQELSLRFDWGFVLVVNVTGGTAQQRTPVLYNLEALPKSLKILTLCGSQILSHELETLFSNKRDLEEVTLGRADSLKLKSTGMTVNILMKLLENMRSLKKFRIFLDMISETESNEVFYCSELHGKWLRVWEIAREMNVVKERSLDDERGESCCGERYSDAACLSHRPFIDMLFKTEGVRLEFLNRIREFHEQAGTSKAGSSSS